MGFSVADIFTASLMFINAMAILSERRFLVPLGLANPPSGGGSQAAGGQPFYFDDNANSGAGSSAAMKEQIKQVLSSIRTLMRMPLIVLNGITIVFLLIFG